MGLTIAFAAGSAAAEGPASLADAAAGSTLGPAGEPSMAPTGDTTHFYEGAFHSTFYPGFVYTNAFHACLGPTATYHPSTSGDCIVGGVTGPIEADSDLLFSTFSAVFNTNDGGADAPGIVLEGYDQFGTLVAVEDVECNSNFQNVDGLGTLGFIQRTCTLSLPADQLPGPATLMKSIRIVGPLDHHSVDDGFYVFDDTPVPVPELSTLVLLGAGVIAIGAVVVSRRRA